MNYNEKIISVEKALGLVKDHDYIVSGLGPSEAYDFLSKLHSIADRVTDVVVSDCLPLYEFEFYTNPEYRNKFLLEGWFYTGGLRKAHKNGTVSYIPNHLRLAGIRRLDCRKPNIYVGAASMPDKHGYVSFLSNAYEKRMIEAADIVILEINPNYPRTFGDGQVHISDVDYLIEVNYPVPELPDIPSNEKDKVIGNNIAEYIHDGACLQLGIGGIPNAVADALYGKKDIGIHTELLTTGMMKLAKAGVINGKKKQVQNSKIVTVMAIGTRELYDYVDDNPGIEIKDANACNDPYVISLNDNQISINTTLEIDLTGQCASESLGSIQFSGTGGQADTVIGAQMSKNGKSFMALYSTAMVKDPATGEKEEVSKIVPQLKQGAAVSLSRNDVDYVVTEYGVAALRGTSIVERVRRLINIAHPKFREELYLQAKALGIIY